jgi:hypothetical protein
MRFYTKQYRYSCGIDLYARTILKAIAPYQQGGLLAQRQGPPPLRSMISAVIIQSRAWTRADRNLA